VTYVIYYFYFCESSHFYTPLINPTFELLWNKLTAFTQGVKKTSKLAHFTIIFGHLKWHFLDQKYGENGQASGPKTSKANAVKVKQKI